MINLIPWTQRVFEFGQPIGAFPAILERLRGTPARASEIVAGVPEDVLSNPINEGWSPKEHLGHLVDLESLDSARLQQFLIRTAVLSPADARNLATEEAGHGRVPVQQILRRMRTGRDALVGKLERLTEGDVAIAALHPRLQRQMRIVDWAWFVAEHDDHHLASARRAIRETLARRNE
jgi:DinB superfamily